MRLIRGYVSLFCCFASALLPVAVCAQGPPPALPSSPYQPQLSAAQQTKAAARTQQMNVDVTALRTNAKMTNAQKQAKFEMLRKAYEADMLAILTPDQRAKLLSQRQALAQQQQRRDAFLKAHQSEIDLHNQLDQRFRKSITADQQAKFTAIERAAEAQAAKIYSDKTLSPQAKSKKISALSEQVKQQHLDLLSARQREDFKQLQQINSKLNAAAFAAAQSSSGAH